MESKHRELLAQHRGRFIQEVDDVQQLLPFLQPVLEPRDVHLISSGQTPNTQVAMLLDVLSNKQAPAFQTLCVALESTYPQLLTEMFVGSSSSHATSMHLSQTSPTATSAKGNPGSRYQPPTSVAEHVNKRPNEHTSPPPPPDHASPPPTQHGPVTAKTAPAKHISRAEHTPSKHGPHRSSSGAESHRSGTDSHRSSGEYKTSDGQQGRGAEGKQHLQQHLQQQHVISTLRPEYPPPLPISSEPGTNLHSQAISSQQQQQQQQQSHASHVAPQSMIQQSAGVVAASQQSHIVQSSQSSHGIPSHAIPSQQQQQQPQPQQPRGLPQQQCLISHIPPTLPTKDLSALRAEYALVSNEHITTQRAVLVPSKHMTTAGARSEPIESPVREDFATKVNSCLVDDMNKCKLDHSDVNTKLGGAAAPPPPIHDIDSLKAQCDWAMSELMALKLHQSETLKKCDQAVRDADLLRATLKLTKHKNESLESDVNLLKAQLSDVHSQRERLETELGDQRKQREADQEEIAELRKQQRDVMSESGSSEVLNMYDNAVDKYNTLNQDYEDMRKRYSETLAQFTATKSKADLLQEQNERIRKQNNEMTLEHNKLMEKHNILTKHLTSSIQTTSKEKANFEKELQRTKIERDEYSKKVTVLKKERDAVLHEYSLVMSERKTVHREIETLENKLEEAKRKYENAEKEKKSLVDDVDKSRRDLSIVSQEKERLQNQLGEVHEKYDDMVETERGKRDSLIKEFDRKLESIPHLERDKERTSLERYKDRASRKDSQKEIDNLKRDLERLQAELADSRQELEDAKKTRDWVFTEREKIVREREGVKKMCDQMRHERDKAISSYMEAVKDADELKKQKADAQREMKQIKEQYDALREKQLHHSNSNDSAIDSDDMHEQPAYTINIVLEDVSGHDPGFELAGGLDNPLYPHDPAIYVTNIRPDAKVYSKLRANDQVVKINGTDVTRVDHMVAVQELNSSGNRINMVVRRRRHSGTKSPYLVYLQLSPNEDCGLSLDQGLYVRHVTPGSVAAQETNIAEGDRILSINGQPSDDHLSLGTAQQMLRQSQLVTLQILPFCISPPHLSSSLSSGGGGGNVLLTESSPDALSLSPKSPHQALLWTSDYTPHKEEGGLKSSGSQTDSLDSPQLRTRHTGNQRKTKTTLPTHDSTDRAPYGIMSSSSSSTSHQYEMGAPLPPQDRRSSHQESSSAAMGQYMLQDSGQYSLDSSTGHSQHGAEGAVSQHGVPLSQHHHHHHHNNNHHHHRERQTHYTSPKRQSHPPSSASHIVSSPSHESGSDSGWGSTRHDQNSMTSSHTYQTTSMSSQYPPTSSSATYSRHVMSSESERHHIVPSTSEPVKSAPPLPPPSSSSSSQHSHPRKERSTERIIDSHHGYEHTKQNTVDKTLRTIPHDKQTIFKRAKVAMNRPFASRAERDLRSKSSVVETVNRGSTEEEIIAGLDEIINQHDGKKERRYRSRVERENVHGGTWPKARPHDGKAEKERPPIASAMLGTENRYQDSNRESGRSSKGPPTSPPTPPERNDSFKLGSHIKHSPQSSDASACSVKYNPMYGVPSQPLPVQAESPTNTRKRKQTPSSSYAPVVQKPPAPPAYSPSGTSDNKSKPSSSSAVASGSQSSIMSSSSGGFNSTKPARLSLAKVSSPEAMGPTVDYTYSKHSLPSTDGRRTRTERPSSAPSRTRKQKEHKRQLGALIHGGGSQERNPPSSLDLPHVFSPGVPPVPPSGGYPTGVPHYGPAVGSTKSSLSSINSLTGPLSPAQQPLDKPSGGLPPPHLLRSSNVPYQSAIHGYVSPPNYYPEMPPPPPQQPGEVIGERGAGFNRFSSPSPSPSLQSSSIGGGHDSLTTSDGEFHHPHHHHHHHHHHHRDVTTTFLPPRRPLPIGEGGSGRVHIPSNHSIMSSSNASAMSTGSLEGRLSERSSPTSPFITSDLHHTAVSSSTDSHGLHTPSYPTRRPDKGETRNINVEKSSEPLGIKIDTSNNGGIFVSSVNDNSLARKAGVQIGDQLLEVCGINLRTATYDDAARILRQCDGSINMLVQYNPNNYQEAAAMSSDESSDSSSDDDGDVRRGVHRITLSRTPSHRISNDTITPESTASPSHGSKASDGFPAPVSEPRFVILKNPGSSENLGFTLIGGNAVGIFVSIVQQNSIASGPNGLRCGDQILEFNGTNFRCVTAEQAAMETARPAESVAILAQYNFAKYAKIREQPGDALYVRALYEHSGDAGELSFAKNDILFVDDTMFQGQLGMWRAWRVDNQGNKLCCGSVWSKAKLEEDYAARYSNSDLGMEDELKGSRRGSGLARRSFFRRNKKHQRNNSKDSRDLSSISDASLTSDSVDSDGCMMTYERVERLDISVCRPVLIIGPLQEPLINKLTSESPDKYCRIEPEVVKASMSFLETGQHDGAFVDFKARSDGSFECITVQSVKEIMDKGRHCMLACSPSAIETLHKVHIYPIVLFVKHKSVKQIREVRDTRFLPEKLPSKLAKELYDTYTEYETKYKRYFSDIIQGGNLAFMCYRIKDSINKESKKALWVQSGAL